MYNNFDVIIPVAKKDVNFLPRVIRYIRLCFDEADKIFLITSVRNIKSLRKRTKGLDNVEILDEALVVEDLTFEELHNILEGKNFAYKTGWYYQQFIKYGFALTKYASKYYLTWDSDTLPLSHLKFVEDNHPFFTQKYEYNDNYFRTIKLLINLEKEVDFSFIAEHMVFIPELVKELVEKISKSEVPGRNWMEKIVNAGDFNQPTPPFSEFETYGTYVSHYYKGLYKFRKINSFRCGSFIQGRAISDVKLREISFDTDTISFEYRHLPTFPYNIPGLIVIYKQIFERIMDRSFSENVKFGIMKFKQIFIGNRKLEDYKNNMSRI